jgi:hypothetical protein
MYGQLACIYMARFGQHRQLKRRRPEHTSEHYIHACLACVLTQILNKHGPMGCARVCMCGTVSVQEKHASSMQPTLDTPHPWGPSPLPVLS